MNKCKCINAYFDIEIGTDVEYVIWHNKYYVLYISGICVAYLRSYDFGEYFIDLDTVRYNKLKELNEEM